MARRHQHGQHPHEHNLEIQDGEKQQMLREISDEILVLEQELDYIKSDLDTARANNQQTGPIYLEKQRLEDQVKFLEKKREKYLPPTVPEPQLPDLKTTQFILSTSSVRRKTTEGLKGITITR